MDIDFGGGVGLLSDTRRTVQQVTMNFNKKIELLVDYFILIRQKKKTTVI